MHRNDGGAVEHARAIADKLRRSHHDKNKIPYKYGNRHARRAKIAIARGEAETTRKANGEILHEMQKHEIRARVLRREAVSQSKALARKQSTQGKTTVFSRARLKFIAAVTERQRQRAERKAAYAAKHV